MQPKQMMNWPLWLNAFARVFGELAVQFLGETDRAGVRGCDVGGYFILFFFKKKKGQQLNWRVAGCKMQPKQMMNWPLWLNAFARVLGGLAVQFHSSQVSVSVFVGRGCASCVQIATAKAV
jgi:hypothetical protein